MNYSTINIITKNQVAYITINRPEVRNALNNIVINELFDAFTKINSNRDLRCVVLTGEGKSFCAGADLNWLGEVKDYSYEQNYNEALKLVELLYLIHDLTKPVIAKVNGSAVGGGVGLMLVSDIIIADEDSIFGLSEVAIGIVPAAIIPFILARIGETKTRELLITGERINARQALEFGLINYSVKRDLLDEEVNSKINLILNNGPNAVRTVKEMINVLRSAGRDESNTYIANTIAKLRTSSEGQEGMRAFLTKEQPSWAKK
jgi:methylglutaconyl-CoA hydratase